MEWASPDSIETACGNWTRAKAAAAGEPVVPVAAARAGRLGGANPWPWLERPVAGIEA
jgi:hypothetical protein